MTRSISRSRPMTGSSLPSAASLVRLRPYCSSIEPSSSRWPVRSKIGLEPVRSPADAVGRVSTFLAMSSSTVLRTASPETPIERRVSMARALPSATMPSSRCSVPTYIWPRERASSWARLMTLRALSVNFSNIRYLSVGPVVQGDG